MQYRPLIVPNTAVLETVAGSDMPLIEIVRFQKTL
jgi:hypothetical protein